MFARVGPLEFLEVTGNAIEIIFIWAYQEGPGNYINPTLFIQMISKLSTIEELITYFQKP